jgi:O-antigen ligase
MYFFFVLLLASWLLPLHLPPWISWHNEVLVFVGLAVFAWNTVGTSVSKNSWSGTLLLPISSVLPIGLILIAIGQYEIGRIALGGDAIVLVLYLISGLAAISLGANATSKERVVMALACTFFVGGVLSVGIALAQSFDVWNTSPAIAPLFNFRRPGANLTQPNQLATLLLFAWASLLYLYLTSVVGKLALFVGTFWLLLGVAITESRTGLVSASILIGWCFFHRKTVCSNIPQHILYSGVVSYFTCLLFWPTILEAFWMRTAQIGESSINTAAGTRLEVWPQLWEAAVQKPWVGWGMLNVPAAHNAVVDTYARSEPFSYAHNIVLDAFIGVGAPVTVLIVAGVVLWFVSQLSKPKDPVSWYCIAAILPLCVHSMLEFPFAYSYLLFPILLLVGVIDSKSSRWIRMSISNWVVAIFLFGVTCVGAFSIYEYVKIEEDFRVARFEALNVGEVPSDYQSPSVYVLTQLDVLLKATRTDPKPNMTLDQVENLRLATMRYPWTAMQNRYALSLALNGNPDEATRQLKVMRVMHGEKTYAVIRANWNELGISKFPQLRNIQLP